MHTEQYLRDLIQGINANNGTVNCGHCALRVDEYLSAGRNLGQGPVPSRSANICTHPLEKGGILIRSTIMDPRVLERCRKQPQNYLEIIDKLDSNNPTSFIDLSSSPQTQNKLQLLRTNIDEIEDRLKCLLRRKNDNSAHGFIILSQDISIGHIINFYVDADNEIYFIDAQSDLITQKLDMSLWRPEIFFIQSMPPEGFKLKKDPESTEKEIKQESDLPEVHPQKDAAPVLFSAASRANPAEYPSTQYLKRLLALRDKQIEALNEELALKEEELKILKPQSHRPNSAKN